MPAIADAAIAGDDGADVAAGAPRRRLTFVTAAPYYPEAIGGAQLSTHTLLTTLAGSGWNVDVICAKAGPAGRHGNLDRRWRAAVNAAAGPSRETDTACGYACTRFGRLSQLRLRPLFAELARRADALVATEVGTGGHTPTKLALLRSLAGRAGRSVVFVRTLSDPAFARIADWSGPHLMFVANAPFVAQELDRRHGIAAEILLPVIDLDRFDGAGPVGGAARRPYVTFINPVPEKGAAVFAEIAARMPAVNFLVLKGKWSHRDYAGAGHLDAIARLANVRVVPFTDDVAGIYRQTRLLLVPSQFPEPFGRVVIEAQAHGIPVVASDRGGLPFAVGGGGLVVAPADRADGYVEALRRLLDDGERYAALSRQAAANCAKYAATRDRQMRELTRRLERFPVAG